VEDTGCGMAPEVQERIFDPFFTTKATGRGLGLYAMLGILGGHGAGLNITSDVGRRSPFRLLLPPVAALVWEAVEQCRHRWGHQLRGQDNGPLHHRGQRAPAAPT